jgi:hypothetical protein
MPVQLDHIAFSVSDVIVSQAAWVELGFVADSLGTCRWRERDTVRSARCVSVVFATQYLDFIESRGRRATPSSEEPGLYRRGIFPSGFVLRADSLEDMLRHVRTLGIEPRAPYEIERQLSAEPAATMRYRFSGLSRSATTLPVGAIEDLNAGALHRPEWLVHPNGATGIAGVHFRAADGLTAARRLRWLTSDSNGDDADHPASVSIDGIAFHFHSNLDGGWLSEVDMLVARDLPVALLAIEFAVPDLRIAEKLLLRSGIRFRASDTRLLVEPRGGYGCGIAFNSTPT